MKTNHTNEQLQAAIDEACKKASKLQKSGLIAISAIGFPLDWQDETVTRLHLLKTALDLLPEPLPPAVEDEQADPYAELKAAHAAGKVIQSYNRERSLWQDCPSPAFEGGTDYRIKPEPAYESAKKGEFPDSLAEAVKRMEEVPLAELSDIYNELWADHHSAMCKKPLPLDAVRARLIAAAKGEQP